MSTLAGVRVTRAQIHLPAWGVWWADVEVDSEVPLEGSVTLEIADLEAKGKVASGGPVAGRGRYRVAGGAASWGLPVAARGYRNDAGVKLSTIVLDLAREVGETVDESTIPATTVGPAYARPRGPAGRVLEQLSPSAWFVDVDGITRLGARSAAELTVVGARTRTDPAAGILELASDAIATLVPGVIVDGFAAVDVVHLVEPGKLRTVLHSSRGSSPSRRLGAYRRLFDIWARPLRFAGVWDYRVVSQSGDRLDLQPVLVSTGMPVLQSVRVRPGVPGARADLAAGSLVLVAFVNASPARPVVVAFDDPESPGFQPSKLELCEGLGRVLRQGDILTIAGVQPGAGVTGATITVTAGPAAGDPSKVYA